MPLKDSAASQVSSSRRASLECEVGPAEAAQMHCGAVLSMTGDADVAAQSLLARQEERGDCAVGGEGLLPFISFDQIVQLDQVYRVDTHPFEASFQFGAGCGTFALAGLGGQKYFLAFAGEPRGEPLLGGAPPCCGPEAKGLRSSSPVAAPAPG